MKNNHGSLLLLHFLNCTNGIKLRITDTFFEKSSSVKEHLFKSTNYKNRKITQNQQTNTAQKIKFSIRDFFSKCDQIRSFLRILTHLLQKSLVEKFFFCAVKKKILTSANPIALTKIPATVLKEMGSYVLSCDFYELFQNICYI